MLQQWQGVRSGTNTLFSNSNNYITKVVSWEKPEFRWIKVNVDVAVFCNRSITGLGSVVRDSSGSFISAHGTIYQMQLHPHMVETMGFREVLSWIKRSHLSKVVVEMDAQVVFNALHSSQFAFSPFAMLIENCQFLAINIENLVFSFVKRSANSVARTIARAMSSMSGPCEWVVDIPEFLLSSLNSDTNIFRYFLQKKIN